MHEQSSGKQLFLAVSALAMLTAIVFAVVATSAAAAGAASAARGPKWTDAKAFDLSKPLREMAKERQAPAVDEEALAFGPDGVSIDRSSEAGSAPAPESGSSALRTMAVSSTQANFEGLSNEDNFNLFGFRVNPPDPVGDVGPNHYVEMVNLAFGVYDKQGNQLLGPVDTAALWAGFSIADCTDPSGDPIVLYDQFSDRWLLSQFTTRGAPYYYNCVAISQTGDPTGAYYRYAFVTQADDHVPGTYYFPDYPKYGVWKDSYILTTRDFGDGGGYGISVYALEKNKMVNGDAKARAVQFFLDSDVVPLSLIGDGLLPPDVDGKSKPKNDAWAPIVGTQDDGYFYGATFDALNIFELNVLWNSKPTAAFRLAGQLPVAQFDSNFPCGLTRGCIPQPGITNPDQYVDILSYRQRPTHRLAYRNRGTYDSLVAAQSVEALPGVAGMRWYEIRRVGSTYALYQQGTFAPADGVHRWMGSAAMDKKGNIAMGYSVSNATTVFPGIRYTGRLAGDPLGQMTLGEGTIVNGSGVQTSLGSRWGDYTSLNVDPVDDCTFWYVNEYYTAAGQVSSPASWQTRIASFRLPGC